MQKGETSLVMTYSVHVSPAPASKIPTPSTQTSKRPSWVPTMGLKCWGKNRQSTTKVTLMSDQQESPPVVNSKRRTARSVNWPGLSLGEGLLTAATISLGYPLTSRKDLGPETEVPPSPGGQTNWKHCLHVSFAMRTVMNHIYLR